MRAHGVFNRNNAPSDVHTTPSFEKIKNAKKRRMYLGGG